jgi:hypothetical protein
VSTTARKQTWQAVLQQTSPPGGKVLVITDDGDRFALPVDVAVRACESAEDLGEFARQFEHLLSRLGQWMARYPGEVSRAYVAPEPGGVLFAVVRRGREFNPAFEEALSDIDFEIGQSDDLNLIKLRAIALPELSEEAVASFLDLSHALMARVD